MNVTASCHSNFLARAYILVVKSFFPQMLENTCLAHGQKTFYEKYAKEGAKNVTLSTLAGDSAALYVPPSSKHSPCPLKPPLPAPSPEINPAPFAFPASFALDSLNLRLTFRVCGMVGVQLALLISTRPPTHLSPRRRQHSQRELPIQSGPRSWRSRCWLTGLRATYVGLLTWAR